MMPVGPGRTIVVRVLAQSSPHVALRGQPQAVLTVSGAPEPIHVMAKPTGAICNLDCEYCFFLSKEQLYPGSRFRMAGELQEAYIRQLLEAQAGAPEVVVTWQGGEPTMMGLDFFRRSLELEHRYAAPGQRVLNTVQTNGTLLDDAWGQFLAEHGFLVGISIDGPRELHDAYRVDKGGKPTFDRVIRGVDVMKRHGVDWNVLTTVNAANGDAGRSVYRFLRDDLGARFVQFIPVVERADGRVTSRSVGAEQYGRFLVDVFEDWVRADVGTVYVQAFDDALARWVGEPGSMCVHAETCGRQLVLEHNGDLYSCDHFVEPDHLLGNIGDRRLLELVDLPEQRAFGRAKRETLTAYCLDCDVRFACNGGCPKDRFAVSPYGEPGQHYLCAGYRAFFTHVRPAMESMARLLGEGRPPAEIMASRAAEDARRGRNAPCPCGSGRKWKQCHGAVSGC